MRRFYSDTLARGIELLYFQNDNSKYPEGVRLVEEACANNEPDAYYIMARCYAWGDGDVKGNDKKAVDYSIKGAELGSDLCILGAERFGELKALKPVMKHTLREAVDAATKMAEAGNAVAQYAVALFYFWGDAVGIQSYKSKEDIAKLEVQNGKESIKWYAMAAEQGHIPSFRNLYISTYKGQNGVPKDINLAFIYAEELKDKVQIPAFMCDTIGGDYESVKNYTKMVEWYERGVAAGGKVSLNNLGLAYLSGSGVAKNYDKAFELFTLGKEKGETYSAYNLGRCYFSGWGCEEDKLQAFELFKIAANNKHKAAQAYLAQYYDEGLAGVPVDYAECRRWAEKSANNGYYMGKYYLGKCYLYGNGAPANYEIALRMFKECISKAACADAYRCLGEMYEKGLGVMADYNQAVTYYQKAVSLGCEAAGADLARFKKNFFGKWKLQKK